MPDSYGWVEWDVTDDVEDFVNGTRTNYGWLIDTSVMADSISLFRSSDYSDSSLHPRLELELITLPGSGTEEDPWRIESDSDFQAFTLDPNYWDDYTRLQTDVNLAGITYDTALIAPDINPAEHYFQGIAFTGVFDGNDHTIESMHISGEGDFLALFGKIGYQGVVKNLNLGSLPFDEAEASISVSGSGSEYVASLAGVNAGILENCKCVAYVEGSTSEGRYGKYIGGLVGINEGTDEENHALISNCYSRGEVFAKSYSTEIGGLAGVNYYDSTISYSGSGANVYVVFENENVGGLVGTNSYSTVTKCYAVGHICLHPAGQSHPTYAGGLVGYNGWEANINNCYARGKVEGGNYAGGLVGYHSESDISKCYSTGPVTGLSCVGGLIGDSNEVDPDVADSYWDVDTSGTATSDGGTGKDTYYMTQQSTFENWDFNDVWVIADCDQSYPYLRFSNQADLNHDGIVNFMDLAVMAGNWLDGVE